MYFGEYQSALDDKGRLTVPRRIRETMDVLGHAIWYVTRGFDNSLFLFHREGWDAIRKQVGHYPSMHGAALDFKRMLFGSVAEARPDRQGRLALPAYLRDHAGISKHAVLLGVDDHLELWSPENWQQFQESQAQAYKHMATQLFTTGDLTNSPTNEAQGINT